MREQPDTLRPPKAAVLLTIWRETAEQEKDETVRGLLCNARVLAESCFRDGERMFDGPEAVLQAMTVGEMETLLRTLAAGARAPAPAGVNPAFDAERFAAMRERRNELH